MSNEFRTIELQQSEVEGAGRSQRFQIAARFVFEQMLGEVMQARMQHQQTGGRPFRRRPILAFVLIPSPRNNRSGS
jgi:hypothetical protein